MNKRNRLSSMYAKAFLNIYASEISSEEINSLFTAYNFLSNHQEFIFWLGVPTLPHSKKILLIDEFIEKLELPNTTKKLIQLLMSHKRIHLFRDVILATWHEYLRRNNMMHFMFNTSHALPFKDQKIMQQFLSDKTGKHIIYTHKINPQLIAGVRLLSQTLLWDDSIAYKLKRLETTLLKK